MTSRAKTRPAPQTAGVDILRAVADPLLLGRGFKDPKTWAAWRSFLAAMFGLEMTPEQLATFQACTGRIAPPEGGADTAFLVCGRRGGKSFVLSAIAVYLAAFRDWRPYLQPSERATIMIVAGDRRQARVIMRFVSGLLNESPVLKQLIESETKESISLRNQVTIEIHTSSMKSTRGYTIACALLDELAFWNSETTTEPDTEIIAAIKPGMSTIPGAVMLCASSPHARRGALWDAYRRHYAKEGDPVLVWQAATRVMNPSVPQKWVDEQIEADPAKNTSEYLALFRTDVENFVNREAVEACIQHRVRERPPQPGITFTGFADLSGGSVDSACLAIAHNDAGRDTVVIDLIRERKAPHSPESVIEEFSSTLRSYNVYKVHADRYAGQYPVEQFRKFGITLVPSDRNKSAIYMDFLPLINSARVELLDDARCINQLCSLERKTARFGAKDSVDHPPNAHDDLCNAVAGAAVNAALPYGSYDCTFGCGREDTAESAAEEARAFRVASLMQHIARYG